MGSTLHWSRESPANAITVLFKLLAIAKPAIASALIGGGLALMILAAWLQSCPYVTGVAMIAPVNGLTLARFRDAAVFVPALVLHATTYALLIRPFRRAQLHTCR